MTKISEINGSVKVKRLSSRYKTMKEYRVTLYRGTEEKLLEKLNGDLSNLIAFCDNGYRFDDLVARHYGGEVRSGYITEKKIFDTVYETFSTGSEPSGDCKKCYYVTVFID